MVGLFGPANGGVTELSLHKHVQDPKGERFVRCEESVLVLNFQFYTNTPKRLKNVPT